MVSPGRVRSFAFLLVAASTAVGGVVPARACACPLAAKPAPARPAEAAGPATPAPEACCKPAGKRACCGTTNPAGACCCTPAPPGDAPAERGDSAPGCVHCECGTPHAPAAPAPAPAAPDAGQGPVPGSLVPPAFVPLPSAAWNPAAHHTPAAAPIDLVISLSRLTC